jgi:hypothetical protein
MNRPISITLSLVAALAGCAGGQDDPSLEEAMATTSAELAALLADDTVRDELGARLADHGEGEPLPLEAVRDIELAGGGTLGEALDASGALDVLPELAVVAPSDLDAWADGAPLVTYLEDTSTESFTFFDSTGAEMVLPLGELPGEAFLVIRPVELAPSDVVPPAAEPELQATLSIYLREIRLYDDHEEVGAAEIYIRCKEGNLAWKQTTDLEKVDYDGVDKDGFHVYEYWAKKILTSSTGLTMLCELRESDYGGDPYLGSFHFTPSQMTSTDHDTCGFAEIDDASLAISRSGGSNLCPQLEVYGYSCPEDCGVDSFMLN